MFMMFGYSFFILLFSTKKKFYELNTFFFLVQSLYLFIDK